MIWLSLCLHRRLPSGRARSHPACLKQRLRLTNTIVILQGYDTDSTIHQLLAVQLCNRNVCELFALVLDEPYSSVKLVYFAISNGASATSEILQFLKAVLTLHDEARKRHICLPTCLFVEIGHRDRVLTVNRRRIFSGRMRTGRATFCIPCNASGSRYLPSMSVGLDIIGTL